MHWFCPGEPGSVRLAEVDLQVGGRYHIVFSSPDGEEHDVSGVYQEVVPHRRLVFSWAFKSTPERVSRIALELEGTADGCELRFTHDRFFDAQARSNYERGWPVFFDKLDALLCGTQA